MVDNKSLIARKTKLSRQTVSKILNGKQKNPRFTTIKKIAKELNCSVDELIKEGK